MDGFVGVYLIVSLNAARHADYTWLLVIDGTQARRDGTPDDYAGCLCAAGQGKVIEYWTDHSDVKKQFHYSRWVNRIGNKLVLERGQA